MVELVDTPDLKSCGPQARAGSTPAPGTKRKKDTISSVLFAFCTATYAITKLFEEKSDQANLADTHLPVPSHTP